MKRVKFFPGFAMSEVSEAEAREATITEILHLQRALEEMNSKISEVSTANAAIATENETLAEYIDQLMKRAVSLGGLITSKKQQARSPRHHPSSSRRSARTSERAPTARTSLSSGAVPAPPQKEFYKPTSHDTGYGTGTAKATA